MADDFLWRHVVVLQQAGKAPLHGAVVAQSPPACRAAFDHPAIEQRAGVAKTFVAKRPDAIPVVHLRRIHHCLPTSDATASAYARPRLARFSLPGARATSHRPS